MKFVSKVVGSLVVAGTFLAGEGSKQLSLAKATDPTKIGRHSDAPVTSRTHFLSFSFDLKTNKYTLKLAKQENIEKYLKGTGRNEEQIKQELILVNFISDSITEGISQFSKHTRIQLQDESNKLTTLPVKILESQFLEYGIFVIQSRPATIPNIGFRDRSEDSEDFDIKSIAIRKIGKEKAISFIKTVPKDSTKPDGEKIKQMVVMPIDTKLIVTKGDEVFFIQN